ncbi:protein FAM13C [Sinocyclocheilus rhinocerous]|uniref:protein FAM13C n=1 Tax=Sinocyclocheilus rhinocerous TaxID=307959 RepID=UPI0007BAA46F|nr:PREDICTED: protein FAM13C-like [Sinocyclocheilus rhinocerous]
MVLQLNGAAYKESSQSLASRLAGCTLTRFFLFYRTRSGQSRSIATLIPPVGMGHHLYTFTFLLTEEDKPQAPEGSLLKLQALEGDTSPSSDTSPEESPPSLGFKNEILIPSCNGVGEERSPPDCRLAEGDCSSDLQQSPGPSRLIQHITDDNSPLPSPRCSSLSQSQRFNTDPESAPSPPCAQHLIMARGVVRTEVPGDAKEATSIPLLTKHIQTLKRKIRKFDERFEHEMNYKPSHNDKSVNPEIFRLMSELARSRKQLKDLKLRQTFEESRTHENNHSTDICRYTNGQQETPEQQHKPSLEETVDSLLKLLREKRQALGLPDNMKEMTQRQMALEKITLQKCLLYFESLHGRPGTKPEEKNLVKPLYDRYQMVKHLLCATPTITTIEEEEGSDDDSVRYTPPPMCLSDKRGCGEEEGDSDPAFVSPLDEIKTVRQSVITMSNLHEASRSELLECLRETRAEKKRRRKAIREFEEQFFRQMGRTAQKDDRIPMAEEYQEYKSLKAKLRLLEVLLSKQETT